MFLAVIISSISQIILKLGSKQSHESLIREYLNPHVIVGYTLMVVSTICIILSYRGVDYKNGPVIESLGYILVMILSSIFLNEKITKGKVVGNLVILIGIIIFYF
ncbi:hypothetical protein IGI49_001449 [Enterococcus sp. AZ071]